MQLRKLTYPEVTVRDSGLDTRDLSVMMVNRGLGGDLHECLICSSGQRNQGDDDEKPAILHSFLKKINQVTVCSICHHS